MCNVRIPQFPLILPLQRVTCDLEDSFEDACLMSVLPGRVIASHVCESAVVTCLAAGVKCKLAYGLLAVDPR